MGLAGRSPSPGALVRPGLSLCGAACPLLGVSGKQDFYLEKIRVLKAGLCSDTLAWNNGIGRCGSILLVSRTAVMINRDNRGRQYSVVRGEILGLTED